MVVPPSYQLELGSRRLSAQKGPPVLWKSGMPNHSTLPLMEFSKNGNTTSTFSKIILRELSHNSSTDIYLRCQANFTRNAVGIEGPKFTNLGISAVQTSDELGSFSNPNTRIGRQTDGSNWLLPGHLIGRGFIEFLGKYVFVIFFFQWSYLCEIT